MSLFFFFDKNGVCVFAASKSMEILPAPTEVKTYNTQKPNQNQLDKPVTTTGVR
jgi:hypothetical protein